MSFIQSLLFENIRQLLDTMLSYFKEENRCYYIATTLVSFGAAYFIKKIFSAMKQKEENLKLIDLDTKEIADLNKASNTTNKCQSDHLEPSSKSAANHYERLDSNHQKIILPEQDIVLLNKSASNHRTSPSETHISDQDILLSKVDISELEISPSKKVPEPVLQIVRSEETPTSEFEILPSDSFMSSHNVLRPESPTFKEEILSSGPTTTEFEISPSEPPCTELEMLPSVSLTPSHYLLPSKPHVSKFEVSEIKMVLSKDSPSEELEKEFILQVSIVQSQSNETSLHAPSLLSSVPLLTEAKNDSESRVANEMQENPLENEQDLAQEVDTRSSSEEENVLNNELPEKASSFINLTNSNTDEFPLDTIPLEMIYKILPLSAR